MSGLTAENGPLEGLRLLRPRMFRDSRGFFYESYNRGDFAAAGIEVEFVQDNHSRSARGALRGLHFQTRPGQAKLVRCTAGAIWDVAVDLRPHSPTFGRHYGLELRPDEGLMIFIPLGFAHGFLVLSETADVQYKCSAVYDPATEAGIRWDDPDLALPWPLDGMEPILSERDKRNQGFREYSASISSSRPS
jgi:dTDP-4-dehydrorhamnose 3,5-epimerase